LLPLKFDAALLLLLWSWLTQEVMRPHTWLAHWLALRLA
jgi:hypothetical protein